MQQVQPAPIRDGRRSDKDFDHPPTYTLLLYEHKSLQPGDRHVALQGVPVELVAVASKASIAARVDVTLWIRAVLEAVKRGDEYVGEVPFDSLGVPCTPGNPVVQHEFTDAIISRATPIGCVQIPAVNRKNVTR